MRTVNSIKNVIMSLISSGLTILFGFITQRVFLQTLGLEVLGINSLFNSIISMMAIAELGFGVSILYNLYQPIAENNKEKIKSLMSFYKKSYHCIAGIIFLIGIILLPFLKNIVGEITIPINIYSIFILFIIDCIASYLLSYKRSLLYANQKNYIVDIIHVLYILVLNIGQILILYISKSYILFLLIKIICRFAENIIISKIVNKMYPFIKEKDVQKIEKNILDDIVKKVKSLFLHRIGGIVVLGSDSIIITKFLGVTQMGLYSNYSVVITAISNLLTQIFNGLTASVGNLLVTENEEKSYEIYRKISFLNFFMYSLATIGVFNCIQPLIKIWMGEEYLIGELPLLMICINFYFQGQRNTINTFKNAAGIFYEDRYIPLLEAAVNLIFSIIFVQFLGLAGVFMGTIASVTVLFLYSYPKYVYKTLFKKKQTEYIKEVVKFFFIMVTTAIIINIIINQIVFNNVYLQFIINVFMCIVATLLIYTIIFYKTEEFSYYKNIIMTILHKWYKTNKTEDN